MGSVYRREGTTKLWIKFRDEGGNLVRKPTAFVIGEEARARRFLRDLEEKIAAAKRAGATTGHVTVRQYTQNWLKRRKALGLPTVRNDAGAFENHILPAIGSKRLEDVRASHLRELFDELRLAPSDKTGALLKPKTIWNIYGTVRALFRDAEIDGLVERSPAILTEHQLGHIVERDSMERADDIYSRKEVVALISDPRLAIEQRTMNALRFFGRCRLGEACGLHWRHYEPTWEPLGMLLVARSYARDTTKTGRKRYVPVHPTLAAILADWQRAWPGMFGHEPTPDDLVVPYVPRPGRAKQLGLGAMQTQSSAGGRFADDLATLGLRHRRGHDLGSSFITLCEEDGVDPLRLREITHTAGKERDRSAFWKYLRRQWPTLCAEVAKLEVGRPGDLASAGTVPSWAQSVVKQDASGSTDNDGDDPDVG